MSWKDYYEEKTLLAFTLGQKRTEVTERYLDEFGLSLRPHVEGQASFTHRVLRTDQVALREVMEKKLNILTKAEQDRYEKGYSFYTIFLELSVQMKDPVRTYLEFARFAIELGEKSDILAIAPDREGVSAILKKSAVRGLTISPSLGIGLATGIDARSASGFGLSSKSGYSFEVPVFIDNVVGAILGRNSAQWEIHGNRMIAIPGENIGKTKIVHASLIIKLPEKVGCEATIKASGTVVREGGILWIIDVRGPVKLICPEKFEVKQ